jgi:uncharacterized protein YbjT (DUF2867 family)
MILITGATGFCGRRLVKHLHQAGRPIRVLLRPSASSPRLPGAIQVSAAVTSLSDRRGVRAALVGVDEVIHLASAEQHGGPADLLAADVEGTRNLAEAAAEVGVRRLLFLSHLGADRSSAYPVLRAKALAEEAIVRSGVRHTIFRCGWIFGSGDHCTESLALVAAFVPILHFVPGDGQTLLQPLWIEDLLTLLLWTMDEPESAEGLFEIGGPEFLTYELAVRQVLAAASINRIISGASPPLLRGMAGTLTAVLPRWPIGGFWIDYLASNRTATLNTLPSVFGLQPARLEACLDHLRGKSWTWEFLQRVVRGRLPGSG